MHEEKLKLQTKSSKIGLPSCFASPLIDFDSTNHDKFYPPSMNTAMHQEKLKLRTKFPNIGWLCRRARTMADFKTQLLIKFFPPARDTARDKENGMDTN